MIYFIWFCLVSCNLLFLVFLLLFVCTVLSWLGIYAPHYNILLFVLYKCSMDLHGCHFFFIESSPTLSVYVYLKAYQAGHPYLSSSFPWIIHTAHSGRGGGRWHAKQWMLMFAKERKYGQDSSCSTNFFL